MGSRYKTFLASGLTCHLFLEHSWLISARVSVPVLLFAFPFPSPGRLGIFLCRFGDGHLRVGPCNVPSGSITSCRINSPIFYSIFPEHQAGLAAERSSAELYVCASIAVNDLVKARAVAVPPEVLALREKRGGIGATDCGYRVSLVSYPLTHLLDQQRSIIVNMNTNSLDMRR